MIDLHCHILPGVDDGSDSPDTSCRMAAQAAHSGVSRIVATPHRGSDPARERGRAEGFRRALRRLQDELDRWSIPIRLLPGSEVLLSGHHARIEEWRRQESLKRTYERRPDLLEKAVLDKKDLAYLRSLGYDKT